MRSRVVFLVAAKTEGEEMGQYVMAVYVQLMASFARAHLTGGGVRSFVLRVMVELCRAVAVRRSRKAQHVKASTVQATHLNGLHGKHCFACVAV